MKITKIVTASAVALSLAFGTAISASAAEFDKDSIEVQNGIVLRPGDTISTENTSKNLYFADSAFCEHYYHDDPSSTWTVYAGSAWHDVLGFYFDENGTFVIEDEYTPATFVPDEGKAFKITYTTDISQYDEYYEGDCWVLTQEEISLVDLDDCYIEIDEIEKTVTVRIGDADGQIVSPDNYTVEYVGIDNNYKGTEFPTEPGKYGVVVTAAETSLVVTGVNDSLEFTVEEDESSDESSESTADSSEATSEDESAPEVIDSQDESTADADASSKADTSSKATSAASTTNPGTGAAAAMGILAVAAAGVAVTKKKSR